MPPETKQTPAHAGRKWLIASVLAAALLQAIVAANSPAVASDGFTFISIAKRLSVDPVAAMRLADQHPGFPAMILAGRWLLSPFLRAESVFSWIWGARLFSGIFGILTVVVAWFLVKRTFDKRTAAIASIIVAVLPLFRQNAADALSDTPHLFFYVLAAWLAIEGMMRRGWLWFPAAGVASGLAFWIRPEGLSVVIAAAAVVPLWAWRYRSMKPWRACVCAGLMVLAALAVSAPYVILAGKISSKIVHKEYLVTAAKPSGKPAAASPKPAPPSRQAARTEKPRPAPRRTPPRTTPPPAAAQIPPAAPAKPATSPGRLAAEAVVELSKEIFHSLRRALLVPLALGLLAPGRFKGRDGPRILLGALAVMHVALLLWLYYAGRYISHRHIMPLALLLMPWIASGVIVFADGLCRLLPRRDDAAAERRRTLVSAMLVIALVVALTPRTLRRLHSRQLPLIMTAFALRELPAKPGDAVLTNSLYVSAYVEMPATFITRKEARAGIDLSNAGPPHRFVVLDLKARFFREEWLTQLSEKYRPMDLTGPDPGKVRALTLRADSRQDG